VDESTEARFAALEARVTQLEMRRDVRAALRIAPDTVADVEAKLGAYWLSRIGIVSVITGVALLIITYFAELGPVVRVGVGYGLAAAVAWIGLRLARTHETFGRIVFGGGLAIGYFVTYALHFVAALRVIDSEVIGVALTALAIACIVAVAHRMRSETVAGIALFLGLHTGMLSDVTALSLIATTLLAAGAAFFLANNRWVLVPLSTVIAVYSTHATLGFGGDASPELRAAFIAIDFALFAAALVVGPRSSVRALALLGLLNWLGALVLGSWAVADISRDALFWALIGFAGVLGAVAAMARWRGEAPAIVALQLAFTIVTLALALPVRYHGDLLIAGWLVLAVVSTAIARRADVRFTAIALVLVGAAYAAEPTLGLQTAAVATMFAIERLHAVGKSPLRALAVAGVAVGLLSIDVPVGYHVLAWAGAAFVLFALGFALAAGAYRAAGFATLGLATIRLVGVELWGFTADQRILTFVLGGLVLLVVSFIYARRDKS
jgi:hypothetical protein